MHLQSLDVHVQRHCLARAIERHNIDLRPSLTELTMSMPHPCQTRHHRSDRLAHTLRIRIDLLDSEQCHVDWIHLYLVCHPRVMSCKFSSEICRLEWIYAIRVELRRYAVLSLSSMEKKDCDRTRQTGERGRESEREREWEGRKEKVRFAVFFSSLGAGNGFLSSNAEEVRYHQSSSRPFFYYHRESLVRASRSMSFYYHCYGAISIDWSEIKSAAYAW